jgi:tetratricopeptide (TPR) repeat protein
MNTSALILKANLKFKLARAWHLKNNIDNAILGYKEVLEIVPTYMPAYVYLGNLLVEEEKLEDALILCKQAIEINPNDAQIQKLFLKTMLQKDGLDSAFNYYKLVREEPNNIKLKKDDILLFCVVKNESIRLPFFLSYYRSKGINKFFFIDNNSTDYTVSYLKNQSKLDIYLWQTTFSYKKANCGMNWVELLLRKYGVNHWCLIVDADEIFYYPDCENKSIAELTQILDNNHKKYFPAILLDMYSDKPIRNTSYNAGENLLEVCPYFDKKFYHTVKNMSDFYDNQSTYVGGLRQRVFGEKGDFYLNKVPLIKYHPELSLTSGQHFVDGAFNDIAEGRGCLLHFKYLSFFRDYVNTEIIRKEHSGDAFQYQEYAKVINENPELTLYDQNYSLKLSHSKQLVELGIMKMGEMEIK